MARAINEIKNFVTGQVTIIEIPWTEPELQEQIAKYRQTREAMGITVGTQAIDTSKDEMPKWIARRLDVLISPGQRSVYDYHGASLTIAQVLRVYDCFAWYVEACGQVERTLIQMIDAGADLATVATAAQSNATWPQTSFEWNPPSP